jgi:hypothetical protein
MAIHAAHIRRIYGRPERDGGLAHPGKISTCVQVGVRPETTTLAHETMPVPRAQCSTTGAGMAAVGRIDIYHLDALGLGFVFDEALSS